MTPETKTAHTSGPWRWEPTEDGQGVDIRSGTLNHNRFFIATAWSGIDSPEPGDATMAANARLIAAAPELLEALKEAVSLIELWHGMHSTHATLEWQCYQQSPEMQRLNAVIAKAEGR